MLTLTVTTRPSAPPIARPIRKGDTAATLADFLRSVAARLGVSPHALDWSVVRVGG